MYIFVKLQKSWHKVTRRQKQMGRDEIVVDVKDWYFVNGAKLYSYLNKVSP